MNLLVTAGNTLTPIDKVRSITNIFTGRTGTSIACEAYMRGHHVTLLTSNYDLDTPYNDEHWSREFFSTFDDLHQLLQTLLQGGGLDAVIHCAAVSDYRCSGVYAPAETTSFDPASGAWRDERGTPTLIDRGAGKVKSDEDELWLRLERTPKLIDFFRGDWGFRGVLVKFKLEVDKTDDELLAIAERSRVQSAADLMVANTLEGASLWAFLGPVDGQYQRVSRRELAARLLEQVERLHQEKAHG